MKNLSIKAILVGILTTIGTSLFAQNQWRTNTLQTFAGAQQNIIGTDANSSGSNQLDIRFYTNANERMRLIGEPGSSIGYLGLGTAAPIFKLDVFGGGILARGGSEVLPNGLSGNRMIWYPNKSAFRAGNASNHWDDSNIGIYSVAFGGKTTASGQGSFAAGNSTIASGQGSFTAGNGNTSSGNYSTTFGNQNSSSGTHSLVTGLGNSSNGNFSAVFGSGNSNDGSHSLVIGQYVTNTSSFDFAGGTAIALSGGVSLAYGENIIATGFGTYSHGQALRNYADHGHTSGLYVHVPAQANRSFIFGEGAPTGFGLGGYLTNDIASSFTIGFKSDVPTFFVSPANGLGTSGDVRIGTPSNVSGLPINRLELNSDVVDASGLTFTQLTALSPSIPANSSNTVLTVDDNGVVILVDDQAGGIGGSDDQLITDFTLTGSLLTVEIEDGNSITVDLSSLQDGIGTDDQNLTSAVLNSVTNVLTISIEDGLSVSVDLSDLVTSSDADWHNSAPGFQTTPPTAITDNIYTLGNVGINTVGTSQAQLTISPNGQASNPFLINGTNARFQIAQDGNIGIGYGAYSGALINATNAYLANPIGHGIRLQLQNLDVGSGGVASGIYVTNDSPNEDQAAGVHATAKALKNAYGVQGISYGTGQNDYGVYGSARNGSVHSIGVYGIVPGGDSGVPSSYTSGVYGAETSTKSKDKRGVTAVAYYNAGGTPVGVTTYGVKSLAASGNLNYGGEFVASGGPVGTTNYGVYARAVGANATNWAVWSQGESYATVSWSGSDRKLKKNIEDITNANKVLMQLNPKTYTFRTDEFSQMNLPEVQQYGLISQELETVLPSLVKDIHQPEQRDEEGNITGEAVDFKGVNYTSLVPVLIQGHKEQQEYVESLETEIENLSERLENLEALLTSDHRPSVTENEQDVTLENTESIILDQNVPNPFADNTVIAYSLPESIVKAQLHFYDQLGKIFKTVEITSRGDGRLNVFGDDLSSGIYTYSLVADGKIVATKRMIKK